MKPGWLPQEEANRDAVLLRAWPAGEVVRVACARCDRVGQYRLAALVKRFGPAAGLPNVLAALAADCSRRGIAQFGDPCGAHYPDLAATVGAGRTTK